MALSRVLPAALAVLTGCGSATPEKRAGYANPDVCAGCHAEIAKSYRLTGMGRSIGAPALDPAKPATLRHKASDLVYTISARDGAVVQRRHRIGFQGRETSVAERRADFAIGSGNHARSFLSRNAEGKFVELPVTWYSANGGYWEMSPGYDRADQEDFRRVVPDECLFCHASYAQPLRAIDCQRCHGPGQAHAESAGREPIVNPKRLSRSLQLDLCMQCHLETTSSPLPDTIRRFDREVFSYRPGEPLGEYAAYFDHAPGSGRDDKFEIAGAAYRLRKSKCFQKSEMTCITCHDPHRVQRGAEAAGCKQCHAQPHHPESSCIECHMPKRRTEDAVHVTMTDHFIRRKPAPVAKAQQGPYRGEVAPYYPDAPRDKDAYLAVAQVRHGANLDAGIPRLEAVAAREASAEFAFELAKAYSKKGNEEAAVQWYEITLRKQGSHRLAIKGLAASLLALRRFDRAAELLSAVADPDARMLTNLGQALLESGRVDDAARALDRAVAMNPDLPEPHDLSGLVWTRRGDSARAEGAFREALRMHPDLATAHANLASALAGRKDLAQAKYHFEKALASDPNAAETHRNHAFLLILMKDYARARAAFETTAKLDPRNPRVRIDLAEMDLAEGKLDAAAAQLRLALRHSPDFAEAHLGLGVLLVRGGKTREARTHLEQAARGSDPAVREAAVKALSALSR